MNRCAPLATALRPAQAAFNLIEAIVVVALIIILTSITVPGSISALRMGRVNQAVAFLETANSDAQRFARASAGMQNNAYYGVRISGGQPPHRISVVLGSDSSAPALDGLTRSLNPGILFYNGDSLLMGDVIWFYQPDSGFPLAANHLNGPNIAIGTSSSPVIQALSLRSQDGLIQVNCRIFEVGLFHRERVQ